MKDAALQLNRSLAALGLQSWPLLTGGKGVHVVIPFQPEREWPEVRDFARSFCAALAEAAPHRFTIAQRIPDRRGRIFLDYLRNQRVHTAIMPYSLRARPGSPVAAPVSWDELEGLGAANAFKIEHAAALAERAASRTLRSWGKSEQRLPRLGGS